MTEAEKLLQETKSAVVAETQTEDICVIDSDLRIIDIPEQFKVLGVESDKDVKVMQFRIPKTYKGTDLSAFTISVNYQNARGTKDRYVVTDKKVSGDQIEFSWTVGKTATVYRGDTRFIVCMRLTGSDGIIQKEFNTTLATMTVLEGLEVDNPVIEQEEKDIIAQLLQIVDDKSKEAVQAVTAEGTKQIKAVQAAAQEIVADREQIKTNKADIADLMQTKAGAIINSAKGERIAVGDSAGAFFEGLKLYGKTEQVQTKGYQLFDASKIATKSAGGATVTNNGDGSFTISGSGNLTGNFVNSHVLSNEEAKKLFKAGRVTLKGDKTYPFVYMQIKNTAGLIKELKTLDVDSERYLDLTSEHINSEGFHVSFGIYGSSGSAIIPGTVKPMVYQDGDGTWEPYTGGKPSPSMEYKQDPESSGDGGTIGIGVCSANLYSEGNMSIDDVKYTDFISWTGKSEMFVSFYAKTNSVDGALNIAIDYYDANKAKLGGNGWSYKCGNTFAKYSVSFTGEGAAGTGKNVDLRVVRFFKARFRIGNSATTHIDYKDIVISDSEGVEFTGYQPPQILSLSTPNGLPGLPVDSGGNYTDNSGQQWICNEMDFKRGKYVQRIKKVVFNGSEDWNLQSISQKGFANFYVRNLSGIRVNSNVLSNQFRNQTTLISETTEEGIANLTTLYVRIDKTKADNANKFKEILKTNNLEICYQLATPIETDIPEETMTAYRKLYTNYPSTVIQNDSGAGMEVEYVADTKSYIDNKLKELVQAAYGSMANLLSLMPMETQATMIENDTNNILENAEEMKHE